MGELEQVPDEIDDEEDEPSLIEKLSTEELLAIKEKHKDNAGVASIIDKILEARGKATKDN